MSNITIRIEYDDHPEDVIDKVNKALEKRNLYFVHSDEMHDGFVIYELIESKEDESKAKS